MQINEIATYTSCKLKYTLIPGLVNRACVCVCKCYISSIFFNFTEMLTRNIIFMTKDFLLALSNQVLLQDYIWKCW